MAGSINKVILIGNLGADPTVSTTQSGTKIVNLRLATSDVWKDRTTGERKERTEWHRVVIFNPQLADTAERYLRKGSKVYIEGQLQTRVWKDNSGADRYTTEVVLQNYNGVLTMLDSRNSDNSGFSSADAGDVFSASPTAATSGWDNSDATSNDLDDDIPF